MIKIELKRQIFSIGMLLALIVGLVMLGVGFYTEISGYFTSGIHYSYNYLELVFQALTSGGFLIFTPVVVVLPGVVQFCDDYNYGFSRLIITRVSKRKFLIQRYISTIIAGGIACMLPLAVMGSGAMIFCEEPTDYNRIDYASIYMSFAELFEGRAIIAHICLYGFIFGMVWSSIGLMFSVIMPNRYVALGVPVLVFYVANVIMNMLKLYKFSPVNMLLIDIQDSQAFVLIYQTILLIISFVIYVLVGRRRLKNA